MIEAKRANKKLESSRVDPATEHCANPKTCFFHILFKVKRNHAFMFSSVKKVVILTQRVSI
ncbi:hypothetical protein HN51_026498 [Arachis hypogaea]